MAIKLIGRTTYYQGKRLFDILCRLKDFGVGRIVYRNREVERYPELSYYVITRVDPDMSDPVQVSDIASATNHQFFHMVLCNVRLRRQQVMVCRY